MIQLTQRLATDTDKQKLISSMEDITKHIMRIIAASDESVDTKESLADFMLFILNVLDIEKERIRFETVCKDKRDGRILRQAEMVH